MNFILILLAVTNPLSLKGVMSGYKILELKPKSGLCATGYSNLITIFFGHWNCLTLLPFVKENVFPFKKSSPYLFFSHKPHDPQRKM